MYLLASFCHEASCLSCHGCSVTISCRPRVSAWPALFAHHWKVQEGREERERGERRGRGGGGEREKERLRLDVLVMLVQLQLRSGEVITRHHHHQQPHHHHHHHPRGSIRDAHADESVQIRYMSIEHEHVAIVEEGESESGWEREDETHGGCCIHVLHADLILTITVLERTHQFHWLLAKVRCVSSFLDKKKQWGRLHLHDRSRYRLDRLALGRVCLGNSIFFLEHLFFFLPFVGRCPSFRHRPWMS